MYLIPLAWLYVALMMAIAESQHSQGSLLGAVITFMLYGVLPIALILYFIGRPARRRKQAEAETRMRAEQAHLQELASDQHSSQVSETPDASREPASAPATAAVRKEP